MTRGDDGERREEGGMRAKADREREEHETS